jgi:hypothetical protein
MFRLPVFRDVDRLPDHLGLDERLDGYRGGLLAPRAEGDAGEPAQSDDRGGCGDS